MDNEIIDLSNALDSDDEYDDAEYNSRRAVLEPAIRSVVDALGGVESGVYRLGDECYGCLKDLKKFWRKDDTDDDRTVARILFECRVLPNDLVPILLETAGKGFLEDKRAIAVADLCCAMTWPIDLAEELKELDEQLDKGADYTQLLLSHLHYKAALLKPGVFKALIGIVFPCLAKDAKQRKERDAQVINLVLHLIRNLAFIKDLPVNAHASSDLAEYAGLQAKLIRALQEAHAFDLLLTISSNAKEPLFNQWNTIVLEIFYLLFRGVDPASLAMDQTKQPAKNLSRLLLIEDQRRRDYARNAASRHSRFGTTISVKLNPKKAAQDAAAPSSTDQAFVLHRQQAITKESGAVLDMAAAKRNKTTKGKKIDELAREDNLNLEARDVLKQVAENFVEAGFNPLLASLLKDIKAERPKISEKDHLRLLYVTKWFLAFFHEVRSERSKRGSDQWSFGLIAEVTERGWIVWVLKRMREAVEEKPKAWNELQAGIECLTQLLLLIESMQSVSDTEPDAEDTTETANVLQQQIIYNGEVLDIAFESLRSYKEGTQSLKYLDSSVALGYILLRLLEKWGKRGTHEMYVRKKAKARGKKKAAGTSEGEGVPDVEDIEPDSADEEIIRETMFTFETFEARFAHAEVNNTLLTYLARYKEFQSAESMKRVVSLLHRQAVRTKAEGLFFKVSTLDLFKSILANQKSLPKEQSYKDLLSLINYVLRKFFKAVEEEPFLVIEAWFPKNRGQWKQFSSWEPEKKEKRYNTAADARLPPDVQVKRGYTWSEQMGIAIKALIEDGKEGLIDWVKSILTLTIGQRQRVVEDTDGSSSRDAEHGDDLMDGPDEEERVGRTGPSEQAIAKFTDYLIPYVNDEQAAAATKNPQLKLVFRLLGFTVVNEDADEVEWQVPATVLPAALQRSLSVICQFLENPIDLEGKKAADMLTRKTRRRRRARSTSSDQNEDDTQRATRREKKHKEEVKYKSAAFIEDSDDEYGDWDTFLEKEAALRAKTAAASAGGGSGTMKATGTKKRRKVAVESESRGGGKKRTREREPAATNELDLELPSDGDEAAPVSEEVESTPPSKEPEVRARPKPRPIKRTSHSSPPSPSTGIPASKSSPTTPDQAEDDELFLGAPKKKSRVVLSDDEE
ncbi:timeless-domain-containing protein [Punctularia strigosozonata HHB-11173 SS5]|uniref:timeless-domain-containing protein n=1 Tax=Punctularia strigosozonata (strain HHB-11173) TaxID=741275 RepID=UPI00044184D5|nr:timeless-domain-containing protein [Punctularia strigosozonata HHB-11173 SS5]EIN14680.1 timeless-domain-containing protein [Punctularia strigosozonata HHB-11173 SS5]